MRLACIGDLHVDIDNPRTQHLFEVLDWVLEDGTKRGVDLWVFAGDLIEGVPVTEEWGELLTRLKETPGHMAVIRGNHEEASALRYWGIAGVTVADNSFVTLHNNDCAILLAPYPRRHMPPFNELDVFGDNGTIQGSIAACRKKLRHEIEKSLLAAGRRPLLLVGHFSIAGMRTRDTEFEMHRLDEVVFAQEDFQGVALTAVGHVHKQQLPSTDPLIIGVGSLIRHSRAEADDEKSYMIIDVVDGKVTWERIPVPAREMFVATVTEPSQVDGLIEQAAGKEVFIDIKVTEDEITKFRPSDFDAIKDVAASLKINREITAVERTRAPELQKNVSLEDELVAYFRSIELPDERITLLKEKFAEIIDA